MSHNDFALYNSDVGDMVCETCLPNSINAPKNNVPKQFIPKKNSKYDRFAVANSIGAATFCYAQRVKNILKWCIKTYK